MKDLGRFYPIPDTGEARRQFGRQAPRIGFIKIPLDTALARSKFDIGGSFLWCYEASSKNAKAQIAFDDNSAQEGGIRFREGSMIRGLPFNAIYVTATAQAGEYLNLAYLVEDDTSIQVENPGSIFTSVDLAKATTLSTGTDVTMGAGAQTLLLAANATRRQAIITNLAANASTIRVGSNAAAANKGVPVAPGETATLEVTAAIYGWNPGGVGQDVAVTEVSD